MQRNRLWVNFSREFTEEYFNAVKEENFSNLVCRLLREYYKNNGESVDCVYEKLNTIHELLLKISSGKIEVENKEEDEDFEIW